MTVDELADVAVLMAGLPLHVNMLVTPSMNTMVAKVCMSPGALRRSRYAAPMMVNRAPRKCDRLATGSAMGPRGCTE